MNGLDHAPLPSCLAYQRPTPARRLTLTIGQTTRDLVHQLVAEREECRRRGGTGDVQLLERALANAIVRIVTEVERRQT